MHFADGAPLTSADVVFSLRRLVNLKGNPSHILSGFKVSATGKYTVVIDSAHPGAAAAGDPHQRLGRHRQLQARPVAWRYRCRRRRQIRPRRVVVQLVRFRRSRQRAVRDRRLQPSVAGRPASEPELLGLPEARVRPSRSSAIMSAPVQYLNIRRGSHEIAIDLSGNQAESLKGNQRLRVSLQPSPWVFYLFTHDDPQVLVCHVEYAVPERLCATHSTTRGFVQSRGVVRSRLPGSFRR